MKILKEYGEYFIGIFQRFIHLDIMYIVVILLSLVVGHILLSFFIKKGFILMNYKVGSIIWIPFVNIVYFLGKGIHSLWGALFCILILLIIPLPHPSNGVWYISSIVSNKVAIILFFASLIEVIIGVLIFAIRYIKYDNSMRIVR